MVLNRLKSYPHRNVNTFCGVISATLKDVGVAPIAGVPSIATDWVPFNTIEYTLDLAFHLRLDIVSL
jgi:hypothetical protein